MTDQTPPPEEPAQQSDQNGGQPYPPPANQTPWTAEGAAPFPPAVNYAERTNPVSIVAIVLGFLVPIGGIIAGIVALTQIRRTAEKGRGLALTGIIVGGVLTLLYIIGVVLFFVFAGVLASQADRLASEGSDFPTSAPSDAPLDEPSTGTDDPTDALVFTPAVGECYDDASLSGFGDVEALDCATTPHDYEVFSQYTVADAATYPGEEQVMAEADQNCLSAYAAFVGVAYEESALEYYYLYPTESTWTSGDRMVSCLLTDPAGQTTGTLQGAAR